MEELFLLVNAFRFSGNKLIDKFQES